MLLIDILLVISVVLSWCCWFSYMIFGNANDRVWDSSKSFPIDENTDTDYLDIRDADYYYDDLFVQSSAKGARDAVRFGYMRIMRQPWDRDPFKDEPEYGQEGERVHLIGYQLLGNGKAVLYGRKSRKEFGSEITRKRIVHMVESPWMLLFLALAAIFLAAPPFVEWLSESRN